MKETLELLAKIKKNLGDVDVLVRLNDKGDLEVVVDWLDGSNYRVRRAYASFEIHHCNADLSSHFVEWASRMKENEGNT